MNLVKQGIEIYNNKLIVSLLLIVLAGMLSYFCFMFYSKHLSFRNAENPLYVIIFALCLGYYVLIKIIVFFFMLFDPEPAVMINSQGVYYRPSRFISFQIPWGDISEIRTKRVKSAKYPKMMIAYYPELYSNNSFLNILIFYPLLLLKPKAISIDVTIMQTSYKKLFALLTEELAKSRSL